ncbi:MAG: NADH-quinone oxidoreductase subunit N [Myxococcales bacterium]|nr:NADH-quinone oxidoreductase subunit N [Myxococcales bacterium]
MSNMSFSLYGPPLLVLYGLLMVLLAEIVSPRDTRPRVRDLPPVLALATLAVALVAVALRWSNASEAQGFSAMIVGDRLALFAQGLLCLAGMLGVLSAWNYLRTVGEDQSEYYALLLGAVFGGMTMVGAVDLIMIFLGLEILSISVYVLAGFLRRRAESGESAIKYFFLGAFSTGFLLYGIALLFGHAGSTNLTVIAEHCTFENGDSLMVLGGMALVLVGLGFKIAAFPFHVWTPDVYQGAPSPVSGFMAAAVKAASFATLLRLLVTAFQPLAPQWIVVIYYLAIGTMVFGNVAALVQNNLKRLLAYSSIAHAGYILVGIAAMIRQDQAGAGAVLFYLLAYTLMTVGAFAVVSHLSSGSADADRLDAYRGLSRRHPWLALALTVYLVSMAGIPPLVGFVGKFLLFAAAVEAGLTHLAIIGVLTSALSVYYYIRVIYFMYMSEPVVETTPAEAIPHDWPGRVVLAATVALVIGLGILPHWFMTWAGESAAMLLGK